MANIMGVVDTGLTIIAVLLVIVLVGLVILFIIMKASYKHVFVIRYLLNDRIFITADKAKEKVVHGVKYWRLWGRKELVPVPPPEALELTRKGKYFVEAYRTPQGEYYYLQDKKDIHIDDKKLEPITTVQRLVYTNQWRKAEERRMKKLSDYIMPIAGGLIVLIVFVMLLVFWGDIIKPFNEGIDKLNQMQSQQARTQELLNEMIMSKQVIRETPANNTPVVSNTGNVIPN